MRYEALDQQGTPVRLVAGRRPNAARDRYFGLLVLAALVAGAAVIAFNHDPRGASVSVGPLTARSILHFPR